MCIKCVLNSLYQNLSLGLFIPTLDSSFVLTTNGIPPPPFPFFLVYRENLIHFYFAKVGWPVSLPCLLQDWFLVLSCLLLSGRMQLKKAALWETLWSKCQMPPTLIISQDRKCSRAVSSYTCCAPSCVMPSALPPHQGHWLEAWGSQVVLVVSNFSSYTRSLCSSL